MIRESRQTAILQAAQYNDKSICGPFRNQEEEEFFDDNVKWFDRLRAENGGTLEGIEIDIPYSYEDSEDEDDEETIAQTNAAYEREVQRVKKMIEESERSKKSD